MIADKSEYLTETSQTIFQMSADERIRKICQDREEYYLDICAYKKIIADKENIIAEKDNVIAEKDSALAEKDSIIAQLHAEIASLTGK